MVKRSSVCVLVSGGLDSDVLLADLARRYRRLWPVYIRQWLQWEGAELYWLRQFLSSFRRKPESTIDPGVRRGDIIPLTVLSVPMADIYGSHWSTGARRVPSARSPDRAVYLPGRNLGLTVKAAVFCSMNKIPDLALGSLGHNPFPDASPRFFRSWARALGQGLGHRLRILAPYRALSKAQVIRRGRDLALQLSFSCIAPVGRLHCGRCNKCAERRRAFKQARVPDQTLYAKR